MTINQLSERRKKLRQQLIENEAMDGFKELLTVLYSDKVHFIYELLQNAEDAGASEVQFVLDDDRLEFEHNGDKLFTIEDVESITNIGSSTKADDVTSIGKFGIGFKAVFAYTSTPEIESGDFHFRIHDMFVPDTEGLSLGALGEKRTRFVFPFDNPGKSPEKASEEIETKFRQLNENTLLFLSNIRKIDYRLPNLTTGSLERREDVNDGNRIEISVMRPENIVPEPVHYLKFEKVVSVKDEDNDEHKKCRIAVAFGMDKPEGGGWKIMPLNPGQVSIYFPAVKETSKLRFHLHAPFASTVARDSVRDCPANDELRDHLSDLIAESMHAIRDHRENGLLDVEFLATLPNSRDNLSPFYLPIQERLIEEFNKRKLTPMKQGGHAPASECYRGPRALSDLINDEDLATVLGKDRSQPLWIANPPRLDSSPEDNFLTMLDISEWTTEDLIETLDDEKAVEWLKDKPDEWHQQLYAFLSDDLYDCSDLCIVLCSDGKYRTGSECHFLDDDAEYVTQEEWIQEEEFHYVTKSVYSSGQNKNQQKKARTFLEDVGVCEVDEAARIKLILRQRYTGESVVGLEDKQHIEDMKRFIDFIEREPNKAVVFSGYPIFKTSDGYLQVYDVFLDAPYLDTGLSAYYEDSEYYKVKGVDVPPYSALMYEDLDIDPKILGEFAEKLGGTTKLWASSDIIPGNHPEWNDLSQGSGNWSKKGIDEDYIILGLQILLTAPSLSKSKLVWQTMYSLPERELKAQFRWNARDDIRTASSSLVHGLRNAKWIPQKDVDSKISFVRPCNALIKRLPKGFTYETGQKWIDAIEFGKNVEQKRLENNLKRTERRERNQQAKEFGFNSSNQAEKAAEFFKEQGKTPDELLKKLHTQKRRKELLIIELSDAEKKGYEIRARSIRSTGNTIDPRTALRARYTTDENGMHCQMCSKGMPFKKWNRDEDYFEAVEALGKGYFFKEHEAQYLALCPECAAEYKEYVKRDPKSRENFYDALKDSDSPQIHLESNGRTIRIWFEEKHWYDLKTVLYYYENVYDPENSDD